jgi:hypothetical protein
VPSLASPTAAADTHAVQSAAAPPLPAGGLRAELTKAVKVASGR